MLEQFTLRLVKELNKGEWYISYTILSPLCKCRIVRRKLKMWQKKEPTLKQIQNAIINQGQGL